MEQQDLVKVFETCPWDAKPKFTTGDLKSVLENKPQLPGEYHVFSPIYEFKNYLRCYNCVVKLIVSEIEKHWKSGDRVDDFHHVARKASHLVNGNQNHWVVNGDQFADFVARNYYSLVCFTCSKVAVKSFTCASAQCTACQNPSKYNFADLVEVN